MIKNIVFDIGNVLVDFGWKPFFEKFNLSDETFNRIVKATVYSPLWSEIDRGVLSEDEVLEGFIKNDPEIEDTIRKLYENFDGLLKQYEYTKGMIIDLQQQGYKVYCLSNMSYKATRECAKDLNFLDILDGYVLSCDVKMIKPEKGIYEYFLKKYNLKAEECIFIDDLERNIEGAKACGMHGIVFKDLKSMKAELDEIIESENREFKSEYTKPQRAAALGCVVVLVLMYIVTLVMALMKSEWAAKAFRVCIGCTFVVPCLVWIYCWIIGKLTKKKNFTDFHFFEK